MSPRDQRAMNRLGTEFPQGALLLQLAPQHQNQIFGLPVGPMDRVCNRWTTIPIDSVQSLTSRPRNPWLHRVERHARAPRDGAKRSTSTHHRDDLPARVRECVFLRIAQY